MSFTHGPGGYTNHGCRCPICKAAQATWMRAYKAKKTAESENAPHGTYTAYTVWGCRCLACKAAGAANQRRYRAEGAKR